MEISTILNGADTVRHAAATEFASRHAASHPVAGPRDAPRTVRTMSQGVTVPPALTVAPTVAVTAAPSLAVPAVATPSVVALLRH